jgi:hypothetical protein
MTFVERRRTKSTPKILGTGHREKYKAMLHELQPLDLRKWLVHSQKTLSQAAAISQNKHLIGRRADTT